MVIYDGAMGTSIQARNLSIDDYWGKEGCSEILVLSRPDVIRGIHESYLAVGADVVETTFLVPENVVTHKQYAVLWHLSHLGTALDVDASQLFETSASSIPALVLLGLLI